MVRTDSLLSLIPRFRLRCNNAGGDAPGPACEGTMPVSRRFETEAEAAESANRQTLSLAGLAVTIGVLVICVFLVRQLAQITKVEDCLMANRLNCDKVAAAAQ